MKQMFQKGAPTVDFDMIIGQLSSIDGSVKSGGSVRIDGQITGDIEAEGDVVIGPNADVHGNIRAANIEVSGTVEGNIHSDGLLKIHLTGVLRGDIEVMSFVIEEGGAFEGQCNINTAGLPAKKNVPSTSRVNTKPEKNNQNSNLHNKNVKANNSNQNKKNNDQAKSA